MAIISNPSAASEKKATKKTARSRKARKDTKFVMVTFGRGDDEIVERFEEKAREMRWSRSALAREMIRKYLGYTSHLK